MDLKKHTDRRHKRRSKEGLGQRLGKQRLRSKNVCEVCLGRVQGNNWMHVQELVGGADKLAAIARVLMLEYLNILSDMESH